MTEVGAVDFQSLLLKDDLSASDVVTLRRRVFSSRGGARALKEFMSNMDAAGHAGNERAALAACYWAQGRYEKALHVAPADKTSEGMQYVTARSLLGLGRCQEALDFLLPFAPKSKSGAIHAVYAEACRKCGDIDTATAAVKDAISRIGGCALLHAEAGIAADMAGDAKSAREHYQKALECEPDHVEALFRLAYTADLHGDEETALDLYRKCVSIKPVRTKALVNLGLLYEEMGCEGEALRCFRMVNDSHPVNQRAKLFLRDAEAGGDMFFDEEQQKRRERRSKILETPISDFELSVRSRNCLEKMNVTTLDDLCRIGEQELLSFKNFGETSLNEIRQIMGSKGLRLGQLAEEDGKAAKAKDVHKRPVDQTKFLAKPVDDLGLSVRSQHCMQMLGIKTIGDLVAKSERELMGAKNFGATSLIEIRKKLSSFNLTLAD